MYKNIYNAIIGLLLLLLLASVLAFFITAGWDNKLAGWHPLNKRIYVYPSMA